MPQHTDNYELKCPEKLGSRPPKNNQPNMTATDVHINQTDASVEVLGIGGIDPNSPVSPHGVGIDANGVIDITGINVKPGDTIVVRLKHKKSNARLPLIYHWTYPVVGGGNGEDQTLAMLDEEGPATGVASAELQPLLEALLEAIGPLEGRTRRKER
jgi:hypothetical protein